MPRAQMPRAQQGGFTVAHANNMHEQDTMQSYISWTRYGCLLLSAVVFVAVSEKDHIILHGRICWDTLAYSSSYIRIIICLSAGGITSMICMMR